MRDPKAASNMPSATKRRQLVKDAQRLARIEFPEVPITRACLVEAVALQCLAYARYELAFNLQAGTCFWPRVSDDHKLQRNEPTHYGYEWKGLSDPATCAKVLSGQLPQLHVWLALLAGEVLVDTTTSSFVERARRSGVGWPGPRPPSLLWGDAVSLHARYGMRRLAPQYLADSGASDVAISVAEQSLYPRLCARTKLSYLGAGAVG